MAWSYQNKEILLPNETGFFFFGTDLLLEKSFECHLYHFSLSVYTKVDIYDWNNSVRYISTYIVFFNENRALQENITPLHLHGPMAVSLSNLLFNSLYFMSQTTNDFQIQFQCSRVVFRMTQQFYSGR